MNERAFTLVELLGSIVILAALAFVAFPAMLSVLNKGQENIDESVQKFIEAAAYDYVNDNINNTSDNGSVTGCVLVKNGYISTTFYDKYKSEIDNHLVKYDRYNKTYSYAVGGNEVDCLK
ncbi:MAG: type II secretion system protein [Bacilli bacterium]|nr:type II secretion system protein [Bacilli bacterium]